MPNVRTGRQRHRLTIEKLTTETRDDGSAPEMWTAIDEVWASVRPLRGRELFEAQQMKATADTTVELRHYAGLRPQIYRFTKDNRARILNIVHVANLDERDVAHECLCREEP